MNEYEIEIILDGKHTAYVKVTKHPTDDGSGIKAKPICKRETVTCLFGSVEDKAKRKVAKIVTAWQNSGKQPRSYYGIKGE